MKICLNCDGLMGCRLLADSHGRFVPERIITEDHPTGCASWSPTGERQWSVRKSLFGIQGINSIRVLHQMPAMVMDQLVEQEREDGMMDDMPDFAGMIADGMTSTEREEQLKFETDENGNFIEDDGIRRPRPSYQLRKFACDPEGHIGLDHSVGMFWTTDKVIKFIVDSEVEQGILTKAKKSKTDNAKTKTAAPAATTETSDMAEGRRVMINRGGKSSGTKSVAKAGVAKPPAKKAAKAAAAKKDVEEAPSNGNGAAPADFDMSGLVDDMKLAIGEAISEIVTEKFNEVDARITALQDQIHELTQLKDGDGNDVLTLNLGSLLEAMTALHDVAAATAGKFEGVDEMFQHPHLLYGYVTDAGQQEEG